MYKHAKEKGDVQDVKINIDPFIKGESDSEF
jgi:hypothetical protein